MNKQHLITYTQRHAFTAVSCKFFGDTASRAYTYKAAKALGLAVGDLAVVHTANSNVGFKVVEVVAINVEVDYSATFEYKWVVDKVDLTSYNKMRVAEQELLKELKEAELKKQFETELTAVAFTDAAAVARWNF